MTGAVRENRLAERLPLDGEWRIEIGGLEGPVQVPGVWEIQGYPRDVERATYRRDFEAPAAWAGASVALRFGAVSYAVEVVVNDRVVGSHEGLWTPFEVDVTGVLRPGAANRLELRVVKPLGTGAAFPYREVLVGFIPYIANTFGGPWQSVELVAHRAPALVIQRLHADGTTGAVTARVAVDPPDNHGPSLEIVAEIVADGGTVLASARAAAAGTADLRLEVARPALWSPESPTLYAARVRLERDGATVTETTRRFGFRELRADGERLLLNGAPVSARGILSWGWDPATLAPAPTEEHVRDEFRRVRALGFNMVKLCLFVPPANVFDIADEEGMLLWLELPFWWQRLTAHLRAQAGIEYADILRQVHHHPSVVIYSLGCELGEDMADAALLSALNTLARDATTGALVCDNSGSGEAFAGLSHDYADFNDYHFYADAHYFIPLLDHFRRDWRPPRPWVFGEYCDCDTFRHPSRLGADGTRPWWRNVMGVEGSLERWAFSEQEARMAAHNLPFSDTALKAISDREALDYRKLIVERTRARRDVAGYVITGLRDTPASTSGVFDDGSEAKFDPAAFRRFNADNVLLLDGVRARRWTRGGDRPEPLDLYNYAGGSAASFRVILAQVSLTQAPADLRWQLLDPRGGARASGLVRIERLPPPGIPREIAAIDLTLPTVDEAGEWSLHVSLGEQLENAWPLWLYPGAGPEPDGVSAYDPTGLFDGRWPARDLPDEPPGIVVASLYTAELADYVARGGRVVLLQAGDGALPTVAVPFWREAIKLLYDHPVLTGFPHRGHAGLQFYHLAPDRAFSPDAFAGFDTRPVIRRLDARLFTLSDYLLDVRHGDGRMLASTLRLFGGDGDQVRRLDASPARVCLLRQMIDTLRHDHA